MINIPDRVRARPTLVAFAAGGLALAAIAIAVLLVLRTNRRIEEERNAERERSRIEVRVNTLAAPPAPGLTLLSPSGDVRDVAELVGVRYLATSGGLLAIAEGTRRRYTTLDGLPEIDLTALAVFRDRLFIGTATSGLVSFDGERFTGYRFAKPGATRVSVLVAYQNELLIGTLDGGLFEYDGQAFTRRINSATGADFARVTAILAADSRYYIGTQDRGLFIFREAHIEHVGTAEGLPSPHVTSIIELPDSFHSGRIAVGTDFGVVGLDDSGGLKPISTRPNITSLAMFTGKLWAGLFGGGIEEIRVDEPDHGRAGSGLPNETAGLGLPGSTPCRIRLESQDRLLAMAGEAVYERVTGSPGGRFEPLAGTTATGAGLPSSRVTALAIDRAGRLWVGFFDRGIEVVDPATGEVQSRTADDRLREVNSLTYDESDNRMLAGTSRGLAVFAGGREPSFLTHQRNGLISDSVAHVAMIDAPSVMRDGGSSTSGPSDSARPPGHAMVISTSAGLTELYGGRARSVTAFHGLASNHLYCAAAIGSRLFVGSLAGLVELEGLRVVRIYKHSNSALAHDWVTAVAAAGGTLYVGTNGGGVQALLPTGEWVDFESEVGRFEVNQNAMYYDGRRLFVGTSDRGLLTYDEADRRWGRISDGLPSRNVTALCGDDERLYLGTPNGVARLDKRRVE